jgi:4-cresol dehydrogenase (hydroxylating)
MSTNYEEYIDCVAEEIGCEWVDQRTETIERYGEHTLPGENRPPAAIVYPGSTGDVQKIVRLANEYNVPLYPVSAGNNIGLGSRTAPREGMIIVDLGRRMNRVLEVDDQLCYAVVEPGVTFQMLHDELVALGDKLMVSATSGPPHGSVLGNALDKGAGYGPYFDHFGMVCGMEIVLGSGEVVRTGDGSLFGDNPVNWHVSKYSFGPTLDGLFTQSNYGIVTRAGFWLMPRPPVSKSFHFVFENDDDIGQIVDLCRPLKVSNFVPSLFRISNDLYSIGTELSSPEYKSNGGKAAISSPARKRLQKDASLGAWQVSACFYGGSEAAVSPMLDRVRQHFKATGARYVPHDEALDIPALRIAIDSMNGRPSAQELGMLQWRPGGGNAWFLPGVPMRGEAAIRLDALGREIYKEHGMDYIVMHVASARFARGLHVLVWNKDDADENRRAEECYRKLADEFAAAGIGVGRAPIDFQAQHMNALMPSFRDACSRIKLALDPKGVIAPHKYGIEVP